MAFTPFTESDQPTMDAFNKKFLELIQESVEQSLLAGLRIETTTYVGTGKSGIGNPTSVTFSKTPEFIMVSGPKNGSANGPLIGMKNGPAVNVGKTSNSNPMVMTSTTWGHTVSWYESSFGNPDNQMNTSGVQYRAIGLIDGGGDT